MERFNADAPGESRRPDKECASPEWTAAGGKAAERRAAVRRHLVERFSAWLDDTLASEEPPDGIAGEVLAELEGTVDPEDIAVLDGSCDTRALWAALTSVFQEVKLQGRAFRDFSEKAAPLDDLAVRVQKILDAQPETLAALQQVAEEARDTRRRSVQEIAAEGERRGRRDLIEILVDLRDRLVRGRESVAAAVSQGGKRAREGAAPGPETGSAPRGAGRAAWLRRLFRRRDQAAAVRVEPAETPAGPRAEVMEALARAYSLSLERLEDSLGRLEVEEIACAGERFDPNRMSAEEVVETADVPEGAVLGVVRAGYAWKGEVLRTAKVCVARRPAGGDGAGSEVTQASGDAAEDGKE